jgi:predicted transcriptional regulator
MGTSTSVHLSDELLASLDRLARELGKSRNRLIVEACESYLSRAREAWPEDFFSDERLDRRDVEELRQSLRDWLAGLTSSRQSRKRAPF